MKCLESGIIEREINEDLFYWAGWKEGYKKLPAGDYNCVFIINTKDIGEVIHSVIINNKKYSVQELVYNQKLRKELNIK